MTTPALSFFVSGIPQTAGSKRAFPISRKGDNGQRVFTGRHIIVDANPKAKDWKAQVAHEGELAMNLPADRQGLLDGALEVRFTFQMPRPQNHWSNSKKYGDRLKANAPIRPITRPDCLKMARAAEDALTGVIWHDDSQIVIERLEKRYSDKPGLLVEVYRLENCQATELALDSEVVAKRFVEAKERWFAEVKG